MVAYRTEGVCTRHDHSYIAETLDMDWIDSFIDVVGSMQDRSNVKFYNAIPLWDVRKGNQQVSATQVRILHVSGNIGIIYDIIMQFLVNRIIHVRIGLQHPKRDDPKLHDQLHIRHIPRYPVRYENPGIKQHQQLMIMIIDIEIINKSRTLLLL